MSSLFSHHIEEIQTTEVPSAQEVRTDLYIISELPSGELWQAFVEYMHLWWPLELRSSHEAHVELTEELLVEENAGNELVPLAETVHYVPGDVIALQPVENALGGAFVDGLSFTFDEEDEGSSLEMSSGIIGPQDIAPDAELGVYARDREVAQMLLGGFARFIGTSLKGDKP
ncbi:hypothetical protein [Rothia sp. ZJ932]|uniref:hypothetical protein n=1 Tax=Rothia sp. ZJ932 TaxID=2810516 RepID=UPI001966F2E5|nr:hypothetical protein [Rothia sp. ZJ932]QRZ61540.1 hypothetical protein JR346_10070 [Rothia sp. ZJ932]